ncbi:tyrosine-type recombinase/integrase [Streptomyces sp. NPDC085929]|uniref:tyrosine-type recombinase/integrase n=1 Tax=Streptomyces sp. NPDC085929 TaxID=3365739 RepID=UPI0037D552D0
MEELRTLSDRLASGHDLEAYCNVLAFRMPHTPFAGLVFCWSDGQLLRPQTVLDRLRKLPEEAGASGITVHDLRHLAATITIAVGVPLTVVSKRLRHSTLSTTANVYSHLTRQAAREAVDTLTQAERTAQHTDRPGWLRPARPPHTPSP